MKVIQELPLVGRARQLKHTFVQGADEKYYKVITFRLYEFRVPPEFATHETNIEIVDDKGARYVLDQPLIKRFFDEQEALTYHQELLEQFDEILNLKAPEKKEHKPAEKKEAPKAEAKPAEKKEPPPAEKKDPPKAEEKTAPPPAETKEEPKPAPPKDPPAAGA